MPRKRLCVATAGKKSWNTAWKKSKSKALRMPTASPLGVLVRPLEQSRVHYDYIEARRYCLREGKRLKDLSHQEMEQFKTNASVMRF